MAGLAHVNDGSQPGTSGEIVTSMSACSIGLAPKFPFRLIQLPLSPMSWLGRLA